jgi:hypothetical protein
MRNENETDTRIETKRNKAKRSEAKQKKIRVKQQGTETGN